MHQNLKSAQKIVVPDLKEISPQLQFMSLQLQQRKPGNIQEARLPLQFIIGCTITFTLAVSTTVYFIRAMGYDMQMPGGWRMSMMWMIMPGETWLSSALSFMFMWMAMMVGMMIPSAAFKFLKTQRQGLQLFYMACGYFMIWLIAGIGIFMLGIEINDAAMRFEVLSRAVPFVSGGTLIITGIVQLSPWKMARLLRCRAPFGCVTICASDEKGFQLGCKQGVACCTCCATLMTGQLILGIMNPVIMVVIAMVITAEKLLPKPEIIVRVAGVALIVAGFIMIIQWVTVNY
jgi:predicted metal-binding membrane protein